MITITQTHQLTFRQLMSYIDENPVFDQKFVGACNSDIKVYVDSNRNILTQGPISFNDVFDVDVEHRILKNSKIETAISIYRDHSDNDISINSKMYNDVSINTILGYDNHEIETLSIHHVDDSGQLIKVWYK